MILELQVEIGKDIKRLDIRDGATIQEVMDQLGLYSDAYITIIDSKPVPITLALEGGERLRLIKVASGG
jgi:sulfur carrier protein ThiS